jgi:hypothetical protein
VSGQLDRPGDNLKLCGVPKGASCSARDDMSVCVTCPADTEYGTTCTNDHREGDNLSAARRQV